MVEFVRDNGNPWPIWVMLPSWKVIHAARSIEDYIDSTDDDWWTGGPGVTVCGHGGHLAIPGLFTRLGRKRCDHCCRALGIPPGVGHPKNDDGCRAILGYPPSRPLDTPSSVPIASE